MRFWALVVNALLLHLKNYNKKSSRVQRSCLPLVVQVSESKQAIVSTQVQMLAIRLSYLLHKKFHYDKNV